MGVWETVVALTRVQSPQVASPSTAACSPFGVSSLLFRFSSGMKGSLLPLASRMDIGARCGNLDNLFSGALNCSAANPIELSILNRSKGRIPTAPHCLSIRPHASPKVMIGIVFAYSQRYLFFLLSGDIARPDCLLLQLPRLRLQSGTVVAISKVCPEIRILRMGLMSTEYSVRMRIISFLNRATSVPFRDAAARKSTSPFSHGCT